MDAVKQITSRKVILNTRVEEGINVVTIIVSGLGELEIACYEDYPCVSGSNTVLDLLSEWASMQQKEVTPLGFKLDADPIYTIWSMFNAKELA